MGHTYSSSAETEFWQESDSEIDTSSASVPATPNVSLGPATSIQSQSAEEEGTLYLADTLLLQFFRWCETLYGPQSINICHKVLVYALSLSSLNLCSRLWPNFILLVISL